MKKKLLAVLMTGIMAMSFAATTTAVYAKGDDDNTLDVYKRQVVLFYLIAKKSA